MDYNEFKAEHKKEPESRVLIPIERAMVVMGPKRNVVMSDLDAGLCPYCQAMVKEVATGSKMDFRIVHWVCVENEHHRFIRPDMARTKPSQVQEEAWRNL